MGWFTTGITRILSTPSATAEAKQYTGQVVAATVGRSGSSAPAAPQEDKKEDAGPKAREMSMFHKSTSKFGSFGLPLRGPVS